MTATPRHVTAIATVAAVASAGLLLAACSTNAAPAASPSARSTAPSTPATSSSASTSPSSTHPPSPTGSAKAASAHRPPKATSSAHAASPPAHGAPTIVIDPGHSPTVNAIDPSNGLNVSDYENEPEMRNVYRVAQIVERSLQARGYRVVMTKSYVDQRRSLLARAQIADRAHAALALSIHDQAGGNGGIGFRAGNNTVYYQHVGDYRATSSGHRVYFTNRRLAATSRRYGQIFQRRRESVEHESVALRDNVGYDLGSRGLAAGNIWLVQLLSHVPWIYNESGGNSAGMIGLSAHDQHVYAAGLVSAVEHCIKPPR